MRKNSLPRHDSSRSPKVTQSNSREFIGVDPSSQSKSLEAQIREQENTLASLKAEIRSRQRLLSQLENGVPDQDSQTSLKRMENEIFIRDRQIEVLNDRVIVMDAKFKEIKEVGKNQEIIEKLELENTQLKNTSSRMVEDFSQKEKEWKSRLAELNASNAQALKEKQEVFIRLDQSSKGALEKEELISKLKNDAKKEKSAYEEQSKSINQLKNTIEQQNLHIKQLQENLKEASMSSKNSEAMVESYKNTIENLEESCLQAKDQLQDTQNELENLNTKNHEQALHIEAIEKKLTEEAERCLVLEANLKEREANYQGELRSVSQKLNSTVAELQDVRVVLEEKDIKNQEQMESIKQLKASQDQVKSLQKTVASKEKEKSALSNKVEDLNGLLAENEEKQRKAVCEFRNTENLLKEEVSKLNETLVNNKKNIKELNKTLKEKDEEHRKQIGHSLEEFKKKVEGFNKSEAELRAQIKSLRKKLAVSDKERNNSEVIMMQKDRKIKEFSFKLKSVETEMWNKDTELLAKDSEIIRLSVSVEDLKKNLQALHAKIKTTVAEELKSMNEQLAAKDTEIKLLKEMIRSSQVQLKTKNGEVQRIRKRLNENPARATPDIKTNYQDKVYHEVSAFLQRVDEVINSSKSSESPNPEDAKEQMKGLVNDLKGKLANESDLWIKGLMLKHRVKHQYIANLESNDLKVVDLLNYFESLNLGS